MEHAPRLVLDPRNHGVAGDTYSKYAFFIRNPRGHPSKTRFFTLLPTQIAEPYKRAAGSPKIHEFHFLVPLRRPMPMAIEIIYPLYTYQNTGIVVNPPPSITFLKELYKNI